MSTEPPAGGGASPCPLDLDQVGDAVRKHAGPDAKKPMRLMAAKGLVPGLPPRDLVTAQFVLTFDADPVVSSTADDALQNLPQALASVLSDVAAPPEVLGHLAELWAHPRGDTEKGHDRQPAFIERILLNPSTPTEVFESVAAVCSPPTAELIANNQARLLGAPEIVRGLLKNPDVSEALKDRTVDFLLREAKFLEDVEAFHARYRALNGEDRLKAADKVPLDVTLIDERLLTPEQKAKLESDRTMNTGDVEDGEEERTLTLDEQLRRMNLPQLIAAATKGNKQVRKLLLRHTNRMVALAAVTSPMIQEPEIIDAAQSKVTHQDAIGQIVRDKKNNWVRIYPVKKALVENPKTPLPDAMRLVPSLYPKDLKLIAKSRNVPAAVRNQAAKLARAKGK